MSEEQTREKIKEIAGKIARRYQPKKIVLFGSYAWGEPDKDSDVDFFVVKETENTRQTAREISRFVFPRPFPMDIIVYTPQQVEERKNSDFFVEDILTKGEILYES